MVQQTHTHTHTYISSCTGVFQFHLYSLGGCFACPIRYASKLYVCKCEAGCICSFTTEHVKTCKKEEQGKGKEEQGLNKQS